MHLARSELAVEDYIDPDACKRRSQDDTSPARSRRATAIESG